MQDDLNNVGTADFTFFLPLPVLYLYLFVSLRLSGAKQSVILKLFHTKHRSIHQVLETSSTFGQASDETLMDWLDTVLQYSNAH